MKQVSNGFFPSIPFHGDESSPIYRRLYDWFRSAILTGELRPGQKIPSTRYLASELKVSRITILGAFQQLSAEGYIESSTGSGTYVAKSIPDQATRLGLGNRPRSIEQAAPNGSLPTFPLSSNLVPFPELPIGCQAVRVRVPA